MGKLTRICATVSQPSFAASHPRKNSDAPFLVLGGYSDFLLPALYANGHGVITGLGNIAPVGLLMHQCNLRLIMSMKLSIAKLYEVSAATFADSSALIEAQRLQGIVARAD